jgi:predicted NAD/FAD-dependent oxidoreductase
MKHCPECNVEYIDTAIRCSDCDVELTLGPAIQEEHPDPKIETVYATGDPALVALVKSLLEDAEIEYFTKGYEIQDLVGIGTIGGLNYVIGPVEFVVAAEDAPAARELLAHLDDAVPNELREEEPGTY